MTEKQNELFNKKYDEYSTMIFRIAFLHLGNTFDAEDVTQNVFVKLLSHGFSFNDEEHEKAWLIRVTQNESKNILRKASNKNHEQLKEEMIVSGERKYEKALDIHNKIRLLPPNYKTAIYLYYFEDYSVKDIARILKTSVSSVKMRLLRGRELLKIELEDYQYE